MAKLKRYEVLGIKLGWSHWCAGCNEEHLIAVEQPFSNGARWTFDGNESAPTFSPSVNIRTGPYPWDPNETDHGCVDVCHYFLRAGVIEYLGDCTHALSGKSVPLPDLP